MRPRRPQRQLRGFCPSGGPERPAGRTAQRGPGRDLSAAPGPRGGSAAGTCGRTRSRPGDGSWLLGKGFRERLPRVARGSPRLSGLTPGAQRGAGAQGKHRTRGPGHAGSSRRGGAEGGERGRSERGGRRRWPSGLAPAQRGLPAPAG